MSNPRRCRKDLHDLGEKDRFCKPCKETRRRARYLERKGDIGPGSTISCPACGLPFQVLRTEHARTHGFKNLASFKEHFGLDSCAAPAQRKRVSRFFSGRKSGRKDNGQRGLKRSPESRARMSAAAVARCLRNPGPLFAGTRGEWIWSEKADSRVYVRSSYERRLLVALDRHPDVVDIKVEPFSIPYEYEGVLLRYIPDFLITFRGGIQELWEVKPERFLSDPQNQAKFKALNEHVSAHRYMNGAVVTLANIERLERWVALHSCMGQG